MTPGTLPRSPNPAELDSLLGDDGGFSGVRNMAQAPPVGPFVLDGVLYENAEEFWGVNSRQGLTDEERGLLRHLVATAMVPVAEAGDAAGGDDGLEALFPQLPPMTPRAAAPVPGMDGPRSPPSSAHEEDGKRGDGAPRQPSAKPTSPVHVVAAAPASAPPQPPPGSRPTPQQQLASLVAAKTPQEQRMGASAEEERLMRAQEHMEAYIGGRSPYVCCRFHVAIAL